MMFHVQKVGPTLNANPGNGKKIRNKAVLFQEIKKKKINNRVQKNMKNISSAKKIQEEGFKKDVQSNTSYINENDDI